MPIGTPAATFLGIDPPVAVEDAWAVVAPAPYDRGPPDCPGPRLAPAAILEASRFVETYDLEAGRDPTDRGVATLPPLEIPSAGGDSSPAPVAGFVERTVASGRFALVLGGDATLLSGTAGALARAGGIGVVRIEGTLGCDDEWRGFRHAPRTATRRAAERVPVRVAGYRLAGTAALDFVRARGIAGTLDDPAAGLPDRVWVALDLSAMDPAAMPMPGNLEPGGLSYRRVVDAIAGVFSGREVVGAEITGLVPPSGDVGPAFTAARIGLRILALAHRKRFP